MSCSLIRIFAILSCALLLGCVQRYYFDIPPTRSNGQNMLKFDIQREKLGVVEAGMTKDEVKEKLGAPRLIKYNALYLDQEYEEMWVYSSPTTEESSVDHTYLYFHGDILKAKDHPYK